jgi:hypothetical protein
MDRETSGDNAGLRTDTDTRVTSTGFPLRQSRFQNICSATKLRKEKKMKTTGMLSIVVLALGLDAANADFTFGEPQNLGLGKGAYISVSADELELYFTSDRADGLGNEDLWVSTRKRVDDPWGPPANLQTINSSYREAFPSISRDGLTLYFSDFFYGPDRPGGLGGYDLWFSTRVSRNEPWSAPVNMGAPFNTSSHDISPTRSHDGLIFMFGSNRSSGSGGYDLWMCTRPSAQDVWGPPVNMGPSVNSGSHDYCGNLSPDGLVMLFESNRSGNYQSWVTMRRTVTDPWEPPLPLPEPMYSMEVGPVLADGSTYYAGGLMYYDRMSQVRILAIVDFNGDGIVDAADMCIVVEHWHTDYPSCDIAPEAVGDGIVDVQDLIMLSEYLTKEVDDPTLAAHWALDEIEGEIAYDSAGLNDAFVIGGALWQPDDGQVGGAILLDGMDDCIVAGPAVNPADGPFSVLAWVRGGAAGQAVISQAGSADWLSTDPLEGCLMTELTDPGRSAAPLLSQTVITDGNWHRIGFVWDGLYRTLYVDSIAVAQDTQDGLPNSSNGLCIGTDENMQPGTFFSGLIDDVRIYNRAVSP